MKPPTILCWSEVYKKKEIPPLQLEAQADAWRKEGKRIATLNGSFDLLHAGHLKIIFEASQMGDLLLVALNTDLSIQQYKSPKRPLVPLEYRLQMVAALEFVHYVTWFEELDPRQLLMKVKPHVHVNGADYGKRCIEADTVRSFGGELHLVQLKPGLSTTALIRTIQEKG
jgi:D-glycero-beta-D-manno-heptose 1-phosphate adenylyltransferase